MALAGGDEIVERLAISLPQRVAEPVVTTSLLPLDLAGEAPELVVGEQARRMLGVVALEVDK